MQKFIESWHEIYTTIKRNKLRSGITAFGVLWGIFMLTLLLGVSKGLENGVVEDFKIVPNSVWMWPQNPTQIAYKGMPPGRYIMITIEDIEDLRRDLPSIGKIFAQNSVWAANTGYQNKSGSFALKGTHTGLEVVHRQKIIAGRYINDLDEQQKRKVAVIGRSVRDALFTAHQNPVGEYISIAGMSFQVVGVFRFNAPGDTSDEEEIIHIPNDTLRYAFNQTHWLDSIGVLPAPGYHASTTEREIRDYLYLRKKIAPDDQGVFGSFNWQNEHDKLNALFSGVFWFSWFVAIGTIVAGAIGITNVMLISVKERTFEIGLRKSIGAHSLSIIAMILQESMLITFVAGVAGLLLGIICLDAIGWVMQITGSNTGLVREPEIHLGTILTALLVLVIVGAVAAMIPSLKAARIPPVVALQAR
jgi:putative ABC transport system permease protein